MTSFIGVSFGVTGQTLCCIATSSGLALCHVEGISTTEAVTFLWSITYGRQKRFVVTYDTATDFEVLFKDLSRWEKDRLFGLHAAREERAKDTPLHGVDELLPRIDYQGLAVSLFAGKIFRLSRGRQGGLAVFDIAGYFEGCNLREAAKEYLNKDIERTEQNLLPLLKQRQEQKIIERCTQEAEIIAELAQKVKDTIAPLGIECKQWYGPAAIAARCLGQWGARGKAKKLTERNCAGELLKAIDCALFGGRAEQLKLGTVQDVRVFDLNSAYGYATMLLSEFYEPLRFTRQYQPGAPFSVWLVDYELPPETVLGVVPTRSPRGGISYRRRGQGYYWQPEIDYLVQRYPGCFQIRWGYTTKEYKQVSFAPQIQRMYDYRQRLREQGNKGETFIKLALSNLYGKFSQNAGRAYYQCRSWAGWITSLIRRLLLEAVTGLEAQVVCFSQDAVHFQGVESPVLLGTGLGQWKRSVYDRGLYLAPGIYDLSAKSDPSLVETASDKSASRGVNLQLDFQRLAGELSEHQVTELCRSFFVGWSLSQHQWARYGTSYLQEIEETLKLVPARMRARHYKSKFNWLTESRDSQIISNFSGQLSSCYLPQKFLTPALRLQLKDRGWVFPATAVSAVVRA